MDMHRSPAIVRDPLKLWSVTLGTFTLSPTALCADRYNKHINTRYLEAAFPVMSHSGVNKATTEDGATYNKLRRPDDYLHSLTAPPPPPTKRKFDAVEVEGEQEIEAPNNKRSREGLDSSREAKPQAGANETARGGNANNAARANPRAPIVGDMRRVARPAKENGMHTMFPGLDDDSASDADDTTRDALAYLRSVR